MTTNNQPNLTTTKVNQPLARYTLAKAHDSRDKAKTNVAPPKLTVILIHGIAASSDSFTEALKYLENLESLKEIRFLAFDLLGSGKSPKSDDLEYNFSEQETALASALTEAKIDSPIVLVGHSMGTFVVARYAAAHPEQMKALILISAPLFRPEDFKDPRFTLALEGFRQTVLAKNRLGPTLDEKVFESELQNLVLDPTNYHYFAETKLPTTLIYGNLDQIINLPNLPTLLKENPQIEAIKTVGGHSVTREKYQELASVLEKILKEEKDAKN